MNKNMTVHTKVINQKNFNPDFLDRNTNFSKTLVRDYVISNMHGEAIRLQGESIVNVSWKMWKKI